MEAMDDPEYAPIPDDRTRSLLADWSPAERVSLSEGFCSAAPFCARGYKGRP
jgi:hypothetical protein